MNVPDSNSQNHKPRTLRLVPSEIVIYARATETSWHVWVMRNNKIIFNDGGSFNCSLYCGKLSPGARAQYALLRAQVMQRQKFPAARIINQSTTEASS